MINIIISEVDPNSLTNNGILYLLITVVGGIITGIVALLGKYFDIKIKENAEATKKGIQVLDQKADANHKALNSELAAFKQETKDNNNRFLQQALQLAQAENDKKLAQSEKEMTEKIASLEKLLVESRAKESSHISIKEAAGIALEKLDKATNVASELLDKAAKLAEQKLKNAQ